MAGACPHRPQLWSSRFGVVVFITMTIRTPKRYPVGTSSNRTKLGMLMTGFCVAKVVKTFGFIAENNETLDEFLYKAIHPRIT